VSLAIHATRLGAGTPAAPVASGEAVDRLAEDCALARGLLWAMTRGGDPAHVLRMVNAGVDVCGADGGDAERAVRARLREALDELAEAGDAIEVGGGHWLPAAVREVAGDASLSTRLLVGGLPTDVLPTHLQAFVDAHGPFRHVHGDALRAELELPTQPLEAWADVPNASLQAWAASLLQSKLPAYSEPPDGGRFRFYSPGAAPRGAVQRARWDERPPDHGRLLVERRRPTGAREYRIAEVSGRRVERCAAVLLPGEHRRLMYALDERAKNPTRVDVTRADGGLLVVLRSELPWAEQRLFGALGRLLPNASNNCYPRTWRFDLAHEEAVLARLAALCVVLREEAGRNG
jgi:hypothetical protein